MWEWMGFSRCLVCRADCRSICWARGWPAWTREAGQPRLLKKLHISSDFNEKSESSVQRLRGLRLRSHLVPEHGARERFLMGANVKTLFFQVPTPEFGHGARARVQGLDLVFGHWTGHQHIGYPVSEHSTILCPCPGTSARAPSVNTA